MSDATQPLATNLDQALRLAAVEARVDVLLSGQSKPPWFKNPSFIISLAAFLISIVTTVASGYRTYREDVEAQKAQLRTVLGQINAVQLQYAELSAKLGNHPAMANIVTTLRTQKLFLAKQAYTLVKEIGDGASAVDLGVVGYTVADAGEMALGEELAVKALKRAKNATEYVGTARTLGIMKLATTHVAEAEKYRQMALHVFDVFPQDAINENHVNDVHAWTELYWANGSGDCVTALTHVTNANKYIETLDLHVSPELVVLRDKLTGKCSRATKQVSSTADVAGQLTPNSSSATP
jgi:hypothetical protein